MTTSDQNSISPDRLNNENSVIESVSGLDKSNLKETVIIKKLEPDNPILDYLPKSKFISIKQIRSAPNKAIKQYTDAEYFGEVYNSLRQGKGVMKYQNGRIYEGSWLNDLREGQGFEIYSNKSRYIGNYMKGRPNGRGTLTWPSGEIYEGGWKDGLKSGEGIWTGLDGDSYYGEWKLSKPDGKGIRSWKNGDRYEGDFMKGLKHGFGTDYFANGDIYIGQFRFGKPYGRGKYIWRYGAIFIGEFLDGLKSGFGKWRKDKNQNSNSFDGMYAEDKKNGFGVFKWSTGNEYRGQFKNDEREGLGQMIWKDGERYIGQWKNGIQHGYGKMIGLDGTIQEGMYDNNVFIGPYNGDIPKELQDSNFDINSLSPPEYFFPNGKIKDFDLEIPYDQKLKKFQDLKSEQRRRGFNHSFDYEINSSLGNYSSGKNLKSYKKRYLSPKGDRFHKKRYRYRIKYKKLNRKGIWIPSGVTRHNFEFTKLKLYF